MGGTTMFETAAGKTADEAFAVLSEKFAEWTEDTDEHKSWRDPAAKPGYVQVWDKPVSPAALEWMRGWTAQNPPEGVDPDDKWGPWMTFPLETGEWHFFGWVNT
jgi:hypothetical protein